MIAIGFSLSAQTTMNIYQSNGTIINLPIATIDSLNFTTNPPPDRLNIYQVGGGTISIVVSIIDSITYTVSGNNGLPILSTNTIISIDSSSAISGGYIVSNGGSLVTQRGVVWNTSQNPTITNSLTNNGLGIGNFTSSLNGLASNTTYFVRAYAINSNGIAYGNELTFTTLGGNGAFLNPNLTYGSVIDIDGNIYPTIQIGSQEWMAENLRTTRYSNGDTIPNVISNNLWGNINYGAWCYVQNNIQYNYPYGKFYNWFAVDDNRNVCPSGWHTPSFYDWDTLITFLGGNPGAGNKMKSTSSQYWEIPNSGHTNSSGFSAIGCGGFRNSSGSVGPTYTINDLNWIWSATEDSLNKANFVGLLYMNNAVDTTNNIEKVYGLTVRCVKD